MEDKELSGILGPDPLTVYAIPMDFSNFDAAMSAGSSLDRVCKLEESLKEDIIKRFGVREDLFIPYIQLHEFEALFYCELNALKEGMRTFSWTKLLFPDYVYTEEDSFI